MIACAINAGDTPAARRERQIESAGDLSPVGKIGAGIMLLSAGEVLLLLRNSSHNRNTWGLPGGNADPEDGGDLAVTAQREAIEEMSSLPPFKSAGQVHTIRGKKNEKQYTVYLYSVMEEDKNAYVPLLNAEHSLWQWFPLQEAFKRTDLHPVVEKVFRKQYRQQVIAASQQEWVGNDLK